MWSVSQAIAQSGTLTSLMCTVSPQTSKPPSANRFPWQSPRRYSIAIFAGRLVPSPFQNSRSKAGGVSPIM